MTIRPELLQRPDLRQREHERGWIFREIGVEPFIQCTGVRTLFGASNPSEEVTRLQRLSSIWLNWLRLQVDGSLNSRAPNGV
ncbi:hypothetical protein AB7008_09705 [Bradyrhizobium sp. 521_C7_N1_3]|uniref:hypothetical protein n=1 Tax=Bradyrhizobium sp. 521_C7_N1_3 TaxID=3240368 RepID=UPI003F8B2A00